MSGITKFLASPSAIVPDSALRLRAARYLLSYGVKFREIVGLHKHVRNLQHAVESSIGSTPSSPLQHAVESSIEGARQV